MVLIRLLLIAVRLSNKSFLTCLSSSIGEPLQSDDKTDFVLRKAIQSFLPWVAFRELWLAMDIYFDGFVQNDSRDSVFQTHTPTYIKCPG